MGHPHLCRISRFAGSRRVLEPIRLRCLAGALPLAHDSTLFYVHGGFRRPTLATRECNGGRALQSCWPTRFIVRYSDLTSVLLRSLDTEAASWTLEDVGAQIRAGGTYRSIYCGGAGRVELATSFENGCFQHPGSCLRTPPAESASWCIFLSP